MEKENPNSAFSFTYKLGEAYYNMGFFNVGVKNADLFGPDNAEILVQLGKSGRIIHGHINRSANKNGTPRVMCGVEYRSWVQRAYKKGDLVTVEIFSPLRICLH